MKGWSDASAQAKVFAITHAVAVLAEFVGEVSLYNLVPEENKTIRTRFWAQYLVGAAVTMLIGALGYLATDCLAKSGWKKAAWVAAFLPSVTVVSGGFMLHGVDSILGSSSGTGSVALIKAAYAAKKKKVYIKVKKGNDGPRW